MKIVEIQTKDGSLYTIDLLLVACIARKQWKNLDGADKLQKQDVCSLYWLGGGELHISGADYQKLTKLWREARGILEDANKT